MLGIKRITINSNPYFGDSGLSFILDELEDDLWVKALDMQRCGFTENIADRVLDIVEYNKTLEIFDLRQNESLNITTVEKILDILKQRQQFGAQGEFQWCATAVTLTWSSVYSSTSKASFATSHNLVHKTRSAPMKPSSKVSTVTWDPTVRKTRTVEMIQHKNNLSLNETKKQVLELNEKLQKEIQKRKEIERKNLELQTQLNKMKKCSLSADRNQIKQQKNNFQTNKKAETTVIKPLVIRRKETREKPIKNGFKKPTGNKNVYEILEKLLNTGQPLDQNVEEEVLSYFKPLKRDKKDVNPVCEISNSQESLYKYMEELKSKA